MNDRKSPPEALEARKHFSQWLKTARPGESYIYREARGVLHLLCRRCACDGRTPPVPNRTGRFGVVPAEARLGGALERLIQS